MLTFKIENKEFEAQFLEYAKAQKKTVEDIALDAISKLINLNKKKLVYKVKDPLKHLHKIEHEYDEALCDEVALTHINDSATYVHNLRRQKNI